MPLKVFRRIVYECRAATCFVIVAAVEAVGVSIAMTTTVPCTEQECKLQRPYLFQ